MRNSQTAGQFKAICDNYKLKTDRIKECVKITDYLQVPDKPDVFCVPWRDDKTPSLSIFRSRDGVQLAKDKGRDEPALNVITLCAKIEGLTFNEALDWLEPPNGSPSKRCSIRLVSNVKSSGSGGSKTKAEDLSGKEKSLLEQVAKPAPTRTDRPLSESRYLKYKKLATPPAWLAEPLDMFLDSERNLCFYTIGRSVHRKGDKIRDSTKNKTWATWTGSADVALVLPDDITALYVFEGVGNVLAWVELHGARVGILVLSSAGLFRKGINALLAAGIDRRVADGELTMNLILDADEAGDTATTAIVEAFPAARDLRGFYGLEEGVDFLDIYDQWRGVA